ncbi:hypothetical protein TrST_g564 [Triparma strigata]|uniref:Uncharacterized protein n=1 Tax=Triparma strigata TaxID=1606541 RepID=A0A9W7ETC1_9STRA|nr:hypothetical protein TrST_g564 [Triparma strigata]
MLLSQTTSGAASPTTSSPSSSPEDKKYGSEFGARRTVSSPVLTQPRTAVSKHKVYPLSLKPAKFIRLKTARVKEKYINLANAALVGGACLSIADLAFDLIMVREYTLAGSFGYATATITTIAINIFMQLLFVYVQYHRAGLMVMLKEAALVVTFAKPGVDAYRVITKQKQRPNTVVDPHNEMVLNRLIELLFECIPSTFIQAMALVKEQNSTVALLSFVSSVMTVSFISASISIEKDVSSKARSESPNFYGFCPLDSRRRTVGVCFCVFFISFFQLTAKVAACALCSIEGSTVLLTYIFIEVGIMYIYKVSSGNFLYWWSIKSLRLRVISSLITRLVMKLIMDFTGMMFTRHPLEMGGGFYSLNLAFTPIVCLYFGSRYLEYTLDSSVREELHGVYTPLQVYGSIGSIFVLQMFTFILFVFLIKPSYKSTFTNFQSGSDFCIECFRFAKKDVAKLKIFCKHKAMWSDHESELRHWLNDNLKGWVQNKPEWFDEHKQAIIPDDLVDDPKLLLNIRGREVKTIQQRRRSSVGLVQVEMFE